MSKSFLRGIIRFFERGVFAPFLLAIQSALYLYLINLTEVYFSGSIRSILVCLLFGAVVLGLAYLLLCDWLKASLVASLFIFPFFLFGDMSDWIVDTFGLYPAQADLLILVSMTIYMFLWIWFVQNRIKNIASVNLYFNVLSALLLIYSGISVNTYKGMLGNNNSGNQAQLVPVADVESVDPRPDIYYIILDGYGRKDILQALYDFDNSNFLDALKERGFYIAEASSSNYVQTILSLSSSLSMDYLQSLRESGTKLNNRQDLLELLKGNQVRTTLAQNGYQFVSFRNSSYIAIPTAEIYYDDMETGPARPITAFESIVIDHTMARILAYVPAFHKVLIEAPYDAHRGQILSTFTRLQKIPSLDGDYFAYAHIVAPHPPFVFDENGDVLPHTEPFTLADGNNYMKDHSRASFIAGYRNQIQYINRLVLETIDAILAESKSPPIIIIQGDHGPGSQFNFDSLEQTLLIERFSILNAYYFPDQDYTLLYPTISPANSFRVVLDQFFDSNYTLIPDRKYYSTRGQPWDFVEVTDLSLP